MELVIHISISMADPSAGANVTLGYSGAAAAPAPLPAAPDPSSPGLAPGIHDPAPGGGQASADQAAAHALAALGILDPGRILAEFQPARILAVCAEARRRGDRLKKPAGWVVDALRRGWRITGKDR